MYMDAIEELRLMALHAISHVARSNYSHRHTEAIKMVNDYAEKLSGQNECQHLNKRYESQFTCEEIYCKDCGKYLGDT